MWMNFQFGLLIKHVRGFPKKLCSLLHCIILYEACFLWLSKNWVKIAGGSSLQRSYQTARKFINYHNKRKYFRFSNFRITARTTRRISCSSQFQRNCRESLNLKFQRKFSKLDDYRSNHLKSGLSQTRAYKVDRPVKLSSFTPRFNIPEKKFSATFSIISLWSLHGSAQIVHYKQG